MLKTVDRILVAVNDLDHAERNYSDILAATVVEDWESQHLNARIRRMIMGASYVELCQPMGDGIVARHLQQYGEGLMFGGVSTDQLPEYERHLIAAGVGVTNSDGRLYLDSTGLHGLPLVVSALDESPAGRAPGIIEFLYEITMVLETDWHTVADRYVERLGLHADRMVDITFPRFGYEGVLMMFEPGKLDRIELSEAHDPAFAMGRFSRKRGDALYMCYSQTDDLAGVIERLDRNGKKWTRRTDTPVEQDGLWIHPSALNGVLMGISRTSLAWRWSGHPERVMPLEGQVA